MFIDWQAAAATGRQTAAAIIEHSASTQFTQKHLLRNMVLKSVFKN